eukprot:350388-Chlamydomonas_euryale.AAC.26
MGGHVPSPRGRMWWVRELALSWGGVAPHAGHKAWPGRAGKLHGQRKQRTAYKASTDFREREACHAQSRIPCFAQRPSTSSLARARGGQIFLSPHTSSIARVALSLSVAPSATVQARVQQATIFDQVTFQRASAATTRANRGAQADRGTGLSNLRVAQHAARQERRLWRRAVRRLRDQLCRGHRPSVAGAHGAVTQHTTQRGRRATGEGRDRAHKTGRSAGCSGRGGASVAGQVDRRAGGRGDAPPSPPPPPPPPPPPRIGSRHRRRGCTASSRAFLAIVCVESICAAAAAADVASVGPC